MRGFALDLAFTVRSLARRPAFLALSVLTLGVGIGASTMVFSAAEALLLRAPPLPEPDRLVQVFSTNPSAGMDRFNVSYPDYVDWTSRRDLFKLASLFTNLERDLSGEGDPERLAVAGVHTGFFETLGCRALLGRLLAEDDQDPDAEPTVVLDHGLWLRRFGGDHGVLGRTIRLDGVPHTIVGVIDPGQEWPPSTHAWIPLRLGATPPDPLALRSNHRWQVIARLADDIEPGAAARQVRAMAQAWYSGNASGEEAGIEATVVRLRTLATGEGGEVGLAAMAVAALLVLLISCNNQASILLVNAWIRARELSLRTALGARRSRLVMLLLGESALLALAGAALGVALAWAGMRGLLAMITAEGSALVALRFNGVVLAATLGLALLTAVIAGLLPAWVASRATVAESLVEGGAAVGQGRSATRWRRGLVVLEVALSVMLLSGAALTLRAFQAQLATETGLSPESLLVFDVRLPPARYPDLAATNRFYDEAVDRLTSAPAVAVASAVSALPLGASRTNYYRSFLAEGSPEPPGGDELRARWIEIDPNYFSALGLRPLRGRGLTDRDVDGAAPVLLVNEAFARRMVPHGEIVGQRIRSWLDENVPREVVGVVPDLQQGGLVGREQPVVYVPRAQGSLASLSFLVRASGDPALAIAAVRAAFSELDADIALQGMRTLHTAHREELVPFRIASMLLSVFGALALVMAVSGVYGLVALSVAQRTRELGVRVALGATTPTILAVVLGEGVRWTLYGILGGLGLSLAFGSLLAHRFVGIPALDWGSVLATAGLMGLAVLTACAAPAWRATRVDPMEALRVN